MNYKLFSIRSSKLNNSQIKAICFLKDEHWKFGIKSQMKWYKKNVKKNDIHNLLYIKSEFVGYTLLRKRTCKIRGLNKKINYLYFDTLIIRKNYRRKNLSNLLMNFNNKIIKQSGYFSFLICKKKLVDYYKKNKWIKLNDKNIKIADHLFSSNGMVFNKKGANKKKYCFFLYK